MRYWWVNQKQTYRQELTGGYMWSPKYGRKQDGSSFRIRFYDNMRIVAPGDIVYSYANGRIIAIGTARSIAYESPKPTEFGKAGQNWDNVGWRVAVEFQDLHNLIRPKDSMDRIVPHLPERYSPLQQSGAGNQVYLCEISESLSAVLVGLIGLEARGIVGNIIARERQDLDLFVGLDLREQWERHLEETDANDLSETERISVVRSRRGQGIFRDNLMDIERCCRVTKIANPEYLIASHIKPWRHSDNQQRLDGENGLLLSPNIDLLFDRGLISFEDKGEIIIAPVIDEAVMKKMTVAPLMNVGDFTSGQKEYLDYHRDNILLQAG